jgi:hypothetical protein
MDLDVCTETAELQTTVPVKLVGRVPIAMFVFHCQVVTMGLVRMLLIVTVKKDGKEPTATSLAATTAPMANVLLPMNVSAITDGLVRTVMSVNPWQDVFTAGVWIILTPASVRVDGKGTFVTSHHALWIATTDSVIPQVLPILPTSASANLDGEVKPVTSVAHTGGVQIRVMMLAITPMNAFVSKQRMTRRICATTQS